LAIAQTDADFIPKRRGRKIKMSERIGGQEKKKKTRPFGVIQGGREYLCRPRKSIKKGIGSSGPEKSLNGRGVTRDKRHHSGKSKGGKSLSEGNKFNCREKKVSYLVSRRNGTAIFMGKRVPIGRERESSASGASAGGAKASPRPGVHFRRRKDRAY